MDKNQVISNLKAIAAQRKNNRYITLKDLRSKPGLEYYVYYHFGRLGNALQAANLPSSKLAASMKVTNENLLNYLVDLNNKLGHNPSVFDIDRDDEVYKNYSESKFSWSIFKTRFGGLRKALEQIKQPERNTVSTPLPTLQIKDQKTESREFFHNKNRFYGKAAELHVTAELLYRGFQAANIPVDEGLDVLAVKNNKTFYFQVKHKDLNSNLPIKLTKRSFERSGGGDVYYIFVLLSESEEKRDFLIIPFHIVSDWIREGLAEEKEDDYLIFIKKDGDDYKLKDIKLNKKYRGKWENIK